MLYSGFCGAILFGKVLRIQSHAQVIFSDPIVIRFGDGVDVHETGVDDDQHEGIDKGFTPCPVLEFRIVNRLFSEVGGEIMDATLNVVANVDADDADLKATDHVSLDRHVASLHGSVGASSGRQDHSQHTGLSSHIHHLFGYHDDHHDNDSLHHHHQHSSSRHPHSHHPDDHHDDHDDHHHESRLAYLAHALMGKRHVHHVDEDPTARLVNKRIFSKLMIEASDHPFFKRVWLARHILDDTSPILVPRVRRMIRKNGGHWPEILNNWKNVKESLRFNQIVVSLNGVSNVSASDVYAQKIYDFVDVNVGYQFVNLLYHDGEKLRVDADLINDVREQNGGGGEPLTFDE